MTRKKSFAQLDREIDEVLASPPAGLTYGAQWPKDRRYMLVDDKTGKDMRRAHDFEVDQIHASRHGIITLPLRGGHYSVRLRDPDEKFAVMDRHGQIFGESKSIEGAMQKAPKQGDVTVRGEYTSDGRYWGLGRGRVVAQREHGRWLRG